MIGEVSAQNNIINDIEVKVMQLMRPHIKDLGKVRALLGLEEDTAFLFATDDEESAFFERENTIKMLTEKISEQDKRIEMLENMLAGEVPKKAQRAIQLKEALKEEGKLTRRQAQTILGNVHHKLALDAMKEAAEQFEHLICVKNTSNVWVLAVKQ